MQNPTGIRHTGTSAYMPGGPAHQRGVWNHWSLTGSYFGFCVSATVCSIGHSRSSLLGIEREERLLVWVIVIFTVLSLDDASFCLILGLAEFVFL